jgi:hypothetical protein
MLFSEILENYIAEITIPFSLREDPTCQWLKGHTIPIICCEKMCGLEYIALSNLIICI